MPQRRLATAVCFMALCACSQQRHAVGVAAESTPPKKPSADTTTGLLAGKLGPGIPPDGGGVPAAVRLVFTSEGQRIEATAHNGSYEVRLPAGTWSVVAADGKACATGLGVAAGASQHSDLAYPAACPTPLQ